MTLDLVEHRLTAEAAGPAASVPGGPRGEAQNACAGLHLIGDLYDCAGERDLMLDAAALRNRCLSLVCESGLTAAGDYFHQFSEGGVTGMIVLTESHMSVHTWPEKGYVTVDVYVCNYSTDNRPKARKLFEGLLATFRPADPRVVAVDRV